MGGGGSREAAGLVISKTSPNLQQGLPFTVSLSPNEKALRRVKKLKRNVYLAGQLHSLPVAGFRAPQPWLITLTYDTRGTLGRGSHQWGPKDAARAIDAYRRWCKNHGYRCKYTWVCELQGNGTPHYHLVVWLPHGVRMPKWDKAKGQRSAFWVHGMTETAKLKSNVGYLMKYLSKMGEFHRFPKGLRLNGNGGLDECGRSIRQWHNLPDWAKRSYGVGECARAKKGIVDLDTGEVLPPAFRCRYHEGALEVTPLRVLPVRFHDGPYCTFPRVLI
jgi:hypothetical protein